MKFNKWTLGLAAVGVVSLGSAVRADEAKMSQLQTALSNTTISGYVDVAAQYNVGNWAPDSQVPVGLGQSQAGGQAKLDAFSLNTIDIAIDHPEDDTPWAAGYHVDLDWGTDAIATGYGNVRQAYVALRTPVGNGIDWHFGVMDDIIGYEGNTDGNNPNYTRSYGYFIEPTTLVGLVGTYKVADWLTVQAGIANATSGFTSSSVTAGIPPVTTTTANPNNLSDKAFVGSVAFTAPDSWGFLKGGTLNAGVVLNIDDGGQNNYYAGFTIPTPCSMLKVGGAFDFASVNNEINPNNAGNNNNDSGWVAAFYANVQPTDKLSFNARAEYFDLEGGNNGNNVNYATPGFVPYALGTGNNRGEEITLTAQYNLWANVISRAEFRWDHVDSGHSFGGGAGQGGSVGDGTADSFLLALNVIYTF